MGKSAPSQPAPVIVSPSESAATQAKFDQEAALKQRALNMVNQYTPQGSVEYSATGENVEGIPTYKVTQAYSPEQQSLYDTSTRLQQQYGDIGEAQLGSVASTLSSPFSLESLGGAPEVNEATRTATRDAMLARLQPQMDRRRAAQETALANQGFMTGTEGFNTAMDEIRRAENDAYLAADTQAGNEMARMYGLETNQRQNAINELLMPRQQSLSELSSLMSGSQPTSPSFVNTPQGQVQAPDYMGAAYGSANMQNTANQSAYNQNMNAYNQNLQGMYGLGSAALGGWNWGG